MDPEVDPPAIRTCPLVSSVAVPKKSTNGNAPVLQKPLTVNGFDTLVTLPAVAASV